MNSNSPNNYQENLNSSIETFTVCKGTNRLLGGWGALSSGQDDEEEYVYI